MADELGPHEAAYIEDWGRRRAPVSELAEGLRIARAKDDGSYVWPRPGRSMPTVRRIADYWGKPSDHCWRCNLASDYLERAHLIDRWAGGLDSVANLALLCVTCHRLMPCFTPGDEDAAVAYACPQEPSELLAFGGLAAAMASA